MYRDGLDRVCGVPMAPTLVATVLGGFAGALLLLWTPPSLFDRVLPWLLLVATLMLAFGPRLGLLLRARYRAGPQAVMLVQFVLGVYGGYFGGAVGLMMMAAWSLLGETDIKGLSSARTLLVTAANTAAVLCFAVAGAVAWANTLMLAFGALIGGYCGARLGRQLPAGFVRVATVLLAAAMTIRFFAKAYA